MMGVHSVRLTATNAHGSDTITEVDLISVQSPPVAAFTPSATMGRAPLMVDFTDRSRYGPTAWSWSFGDGNGSTVQNPSHIFDQPGIYTVALTATNTSGSHMFQRLDLIRVFPEPAAAAFDMDVTQGPAPLSVRFTDQSGGDPDTWSWSFGDGAGSAATDPSHTFMRAGTYLVSLTVSNASGPDTVSDTVVIEAPPGDTFRRGDSNSDAVVDISDAIQTLSVLFLGDGKILCEDAADSNDDGGVDISDAINTLSVLFVGIGKIPPPGKLTCGPDPTEDPRSCDAYDAACN